MYGFITNLVYVMPSKKELPVLRVSKEIEGFEYHKIVHIINEYSANFVSALLSREYEGLASGVYITSIGDYKDEDMLKRDLRSALEKYLEKRSPGSSHESTNWQSQFFDKRDALDNFVNNIEIEHVNIPSASYIVANLLSNLLEKIIPKNIQCHEVGVKICIQLDKKMLESLLEEDEWKTEPLFYFCKEYPNLCGEENNSCSKFFKVVKQFWIRFQHSIIDYEDRIYMILRSRYRRISNLDLNNVISFLLIKGMELSILKGVRVNVKTERGTGLYEIKNVIRNKDSCVFELVYDIGGGKQEQKRIELSELSKYNVSINPTYRSSRSFIEHYLCKEFDKHRDLSKITPNEYFSFLGNDLRIFKRLIAQYAGNKLTLGGISYMIGEDFVRVEVI